jgi:hypothetical protein
MPLTGSHPVSRSGPIANPTTRQKSFLTLMNSKATRQGGRDPPVYCNLRSNCDRTSEQKARCRVVGFAIGPDRLTGSSPLWVHQAWTCPLCRSPLAYVVGVTSLAEHLLFEIICQADARGLEITMDPELGSMIAAMVSDIIARLQLRPGLVPNAGARGSEDIDSDE